MANYSQQIKACKLYIRHYAGLSIHLAASRVGPLGDKLKELEDFAIIVLYYVTKMRLIRQIQAGEDIEDVAPDGLRKAAIEEIRRRMSRELKDGVIKSLSDSD